MSDLSIPRGAWAGWRLNLDREMTDLALRIVELGREDGTYPPLDPISIVHVVRPPDAAGRVDARTDIFDFDVVRALRVERRPRDELILPPGVRG